MCSLSQVQREKKNDLLMELEQLKEAYLTVSTVVQSSAATIIKTSDMITGSGHNSPRIITAAGPLAR
jgi:hypothetical protein